MTPMEDNLNGRDPWQMTSKNKNWIFSATNGWILIKFETKT
jgi:hypothetical protein